MANFSAIFPAAEKILVIYKHAAESEALGFVFDIYLRRNFKRILFDDCKVVENIKRVHTKKFLRKSINSPHRSEVSVCGNSDFTAVCSYRKTFVRQWLGEIFFVFFYHDTAVGFFGNDFRSNASRTHPFKIVREVVYG